MSPSEPKDEYLDVSENMRHYGNMRFAQLTLFAGITAGLLSIMVAGSPPSGSLKVTIPLGGLVVTFAFWIIEERAALFFHSYRRRSVELEQLLGYRQHTNRPEGKLVTAANAVRLLFLGTAVFWLAQLLLLISCFR